MNIYRTWRLFHKPERHYHKLSYKLESMSCRLNELNNRRKIIQREIDELSKSNSVCAKCQGACCKGEYDHFTAINYLIRSFSDNPLKGYGDLWKPIPLYALILKKIMPSSKNISSGDIKQINGCPHLSTLGCNLEVEDRPIRCVIWTCRDFREALPHRNLVKIGKLIKELDSISKKVVRIFNKSY